MTASPEQSPAAPSTGRRVPEFFIIGNPKSGTTALYEMLEPHPQIYMPPLGTQFFALDQARNPDTLEEYLRLFDAAEPGQRVGEMSRGYLWSRTAADGIAELAPDARIIAILREPASFLRSLHLELLQDHVETEKDLGRAIELEAERRKGQDPADQRGLRYSPERVDYLTQLQRYREHFPDERMLVLIYEEFRADNRAAIREVLRFLDVDDTFSIDVTQANPTVLVRSTRLHGAVRSLYMGDGGAGGMKSTVKAVVPRSVRRASLRVLRRNVLYSQPPPVDEELMLELRRRFRGQVEALGEYLGRDLVRLWGYDRLS
jgi:sulfotransferase family protein